MNNETSIKELRLKLKVLEKIISIGITEKDMTNFSAKDYWELYKSNKFSEKEGDILLEMIEYVKKKKLYEYLSFKENEDIKEEGEV